MKSMTKRFGRSNFNSKLIVRMLLEAEIKRAGGKKTDAVCRELGIFEKKLPQPG